MLLAKKISSFVTLKLNISAVFVWLVLTVIFTLGTQHQSVAQYYSQSFNGCNAANCSGWTISGGWGGGGGPQISTTTTNGRLPCANSTAMSNIYGSATTTTLRSNGSLFTSNGSSIELSFDYRVRNYNSGATSPSNYVTFTASWSTNGTAWNTVGSFNNVSSASCQNYSFPEFTPANGNSVYIRIVAVRTNGDVYAHFDNIAINAPCSGWDIGGNSTNPQALQSNCNWRNIPLGSGSYENFTIPAGTWIDFDAPALSGQFNQMRITPQNGSGSGGTFTLNSNGTQNSWYSGTTTTIRASARRNACWSNTSAVLRYRKSQPSGITANSDRTSLCAGGAFNLSTSGGTIASSQTGISYTWTGGYNPPDVYNPGNHTSSTTSQSGTYTVTASNGGCTRADGIAISVVNDASSVSAAKVPTAATVCVGQALSVTPSGGTGGLGCSWRYRRRINGGSWSGWSGSSSYTTVSGNTLVEIQTQRYCTGNGCGDPNAIVSWNVVEDPSAPTATKVPNVSTVCVGTVLNVTSSGSTGGTGTCIYQERKRVNGGTWTSWASNVSHTVVAGNNLVEMQVRRNCNGSNCSDPTSSIVSWSINNNGTADGTWVGNVSSDWTDCRNWGGGVVPTAGTNVTIQNGSPNDPIVSSVVPVVNAIYVLAGAHLRVTAGRLETDNQWQGGAALRNDGLFEVSGGYVDLNTQGFRQYNSGTFNMTGGTLYTSEWLYNSNNHTNTVMNISGGYLDVNRIPNYAGVINHSGGTIDCRGYYRENDATTPGAYNGSGTAVINFRGTSNQYFHLWNSGTEFNDVNIYGNAYYISTASVVPLDVDGDFHIRTGGSLDCNSEPITVAGDYDNNGTFIADNGTVTFDGSGAQAVNAGGTGNNKDFYNCSVTNAGTVTLSSDMEVDATFRVYAGAFTMTNQNLYTANLGNVGSTRIDAGAVVSVNGASSQWRQANGNRNTDIYGELDLNNGLVHSGGNQRLYASGVINQTGGRFGGGDQIRIDGDYNGDGGTLQLWSSIDTWAPQLYVTNASAYFYNLEGDDNGSSRCNILAASQTIDVDNDVVILGGANLDANGVNIEVGGDWTNNGNIQGAYLGYTADNNTVTFTGGGNIAGSVKTTFYDVINTGGTRIQTVNTDVLNDLTVSSGQYRIDGGNTLTFANGSVATVASGGTFRANGTSGNTANVAVASGNYTFTVNGAMRAKYGVFSGMGGNGINLSSGTATLPTATEDFDNCTFSNWSGSQALLLRDNLGIAGSTMSFTNAGGINISHVTPAASNAQVTVTGAANGSRWGEAYDGETEGATYSQIDWADTYTFTVSGSNFGGGTPADGTYYYGNESGNNAPGTSVIAVSGSCGTGYAGTGSAPSGTGNSSPTFSITSNSTLTWNWDTPASSILWTGNEDDDWHNEANWSCYGLPGSTTTVTLDPSNLTGAGASPVIYDDMVGECLTIDIVSGITIEIANDILSGSTSPTATRLEVNTP